MKSYECTIIISPGVGEDKFKEITRRYADVVASGGGELTKIDSWGKRRLAYAIKRHEEGHYAVFNFRCESSVLEELNRQLRLDENVLRHMIVRDLLATGKEPKVDLDGGRPFESDDKEES